MWPLCGWPTYHCKHQWKPNRSHAQGDPALRSSPYRHLLTGIHDRRRSMSLKGKVAIVTGGNSGIGKSIVLALAEAGANIVIDYVANEQATEELEASVAKLDDKAIGV